MSYHKYRPFAPIPFDDVWTERKWPSRVITRAPRWCSVDLRDGNQALINPMDMAKKLKLFEHLVKLGYKEIEVGFPSASEIDFEFCRHIIENKLLPDDVWIQVLTQAREELIRKTIAAVKGAPKVILHLYNSTSTLQREVVFAKSREAIKQMATDGTALLRTLVDQELHESRVRLEYSPESFSGTELDFALDVCHGVMDVWRPTEENTIIFNLPATVEMSTPNIYADMIEWMHTHLKDRSKIVLSLHAHNDRGTGIAATELAYMAGADRVEGCLFGNGERTGNVCLVTLAINLFSQGIDPEVDFSDLPASIAVHEHCTELTVPPRWPWAGELVYTAFSGSHQDAIKKGMQVVKSTSAGVWEVPYLPLDPKDIGRSYEAIVRINAQSGKGGLAYVLETEYGIEMPRRMQIEFSALMQTVSDKLAREIRPAEVHAIFNKIYVWPTEPLLLHAYGIEQLVTDGPVLLRCTVSYNAQRLDATGAGNGPVAAFVAAINSIVGPERGIEVAGYSQHAIGKGADAEAIAYIEIGAADKVKFGVGRDANTTTASLKAICSGFNHVFGAPRTLIEPGDDIVSSAPARPAVEILYFAGP